MLRKNNLIWFFSLFLGVFLLLGSFLVPWLAVKNRFDGSQPQRDLFLSLNSSQILNQTFTAEHDFINIIILYFKNPGLANKEEYLFTLKGINGEVLVSQPFSGYNIGDPSDIRFQFEPLVGSKGKKYTIELTTDSKTEPSIGVGAEEKKGLSYSVYYRTNNKKLALVDLVFGFWRRFFTDWLFALFWLSVLTGLLILGWGKTDEKK